MPAVTMIVSAAAIILLVKYGLLNAIDQIAGATKMSSKARGQLTGYATSVPELVCLVSAGLAGVWDAGLWNIASSNIINLFLMLLAVLYYRQWKDLMNRTFLDEIFFAGAAIVVPIVLMQYQVDTEWYLVPILLSFFFIYRVVDRWINVPHEDETEVASGSLPVGVILAVTAMVAISIMGIFLGDATAKVVEQLGIRPVIAGWILGVITSLPEMVSFFAVYASAHKAGELHKLSDTQEALDNLTGSNMANVGFVYPVGLMTYLVATWLWG